MSASMDTLCKVKIETIAMPLLTTKHLRLPWIKCHLSLQTCLYCDNVKDKKSKPTGNKYRDTVYLPKTDFVLSLKKAGDGFKVIFIIVYPTVPPH